MSTAWFFTCGVDGSECDIEINNGDDQLRTLFRAWPTVRTLADRINTDPVFADIEITYLWGGASIFSWLLEHDGHAVRLANEYGHSEPLMAAALEYVERGTGCQYEATHGECRYCEHFKTRLAKQAQEGH